MGYFKTPYNILSKDVKYFSRGEGIWKKIKTKRDFSKVKRI